MADGSLHPATLASPPYASPSDHAECRRLHRRHGTTYYFATQRFSPPLRRRVNALYGFVRVPDEWVDNPSLYGITDPGAALKRYRESLVCAYEGTCPDEPALRAFVDVMGECGMTLEEPLLFLDAMAQDLVQTRYETYEDLQAYMRGSASAVGVMMCDLFGVPKSDVVLEPAKALGEAMQLTNFLRDVAEDARRGRIYLPQEDLDRFSIPQSEILEGRMSERFANLARYEIAKARALYAQADNGVPLLPQEAQKAVRLARILYSRILDRIEARDYDVFSGRARTGKVEKLVVAAGVLAGRL
ncbi:phytoene/squalene synthase family protein [bacterium]|nr:MAG: phytoene/squalene synthase family protein [bacterium]